MDSVENMNYLLATVQIMDLKQKKQLLEVWEDTEELIRLELLRVQVQNMKEGLVWPSHAPMDGKTVIKTTMKVCVMTVR